MAETTDGVVPDGSSAGVRVEAAWDHPGAPDAFQRLWTPHRMVYIGGQDKPRDSSHHQCPFCRAPGRTDQDSLIVHRGRSAYVLMNLYPYHTGHLLVCPYRHVSDWTQASAAERVEIGELTARAMEVLRAVSHPQGFNLGVNQGEVAGAGIAAHLHQHVVPRWRGDANFMPLIARTKPVPQLLGDQREVLAAAWDEAPGGDAPVGDAPVGGPAGDSPAGGAPAGGPAEGAPGDAPAAAPG